VYTILYPHLSAKEENIMHDPTFAHHFGQAVQSDILRQAAADRQRRQAWTVQCDEKPATPARRTIIASRAWGKVRAYLRRAGTQTTARSSALAER
jgi:hypothetical protein